eukprot:scaffold447_cov307-Pinguiococcus_pyrenoidosus.AAC.89
MMRSLLSFVPILCLFASSKVLLARGQDAEQWDPREDFDDDYVLDGYGRGDTIEEGTDDQKLVEELRERMNEPDIRHIEDEPIPDAVDTSTSQALNEIAERFKQIIEHLKYLDRTILKHHR